MLWFYGIPVGRSCKSRFSHQRFLMYFLLSASLDSPILLIKLFWRIDELHDDIHIDECLKGLRVTKLFCYTSNTK